MNDFEKAENIDMTEAQSEMEPPAKAKDADGKSCRKKIPKFGMILWSCS